MSRKLGAKPWKHWRGERKFAPSRIEHDGRSLVVRTNGSLALYTIATEIDAQIGDLQLVHSEIGVKTLRTLLDIPTPTETMPMAALQAFAGHKTTWSKSKVVRVDVRGVHIDRPKLAWVLRYISAQTIRIGATRQSFGPCVIVESDEAATWWRIVIVGLMPAILNSDKIVSVLPKSDGAE